MQRHRPASPAWVDGRVPVANVLLAIASNFDAMNGCAREQALVMQVERYCRAHPIASPTSGQE
jgi:hypothetical protein